MDEELLAELVRMLDKALHTTARSCLKKLVGPQLSHKATKQTSKWLFGCQDQRLRIEDRIRRRGVSEIDKLLKYMGKAISELNELE